MLMLLVAALLLHASQRPMAPAAPTTGTAVLRGQITDTETGQPIPRAVVTVRLFREGPPLGWQNFADAEGRFEFLNLPAGRVEVSATAGEHRATHLAESGRSSPGPPNSLSVLTLGEGEVRENVNIALPRAFAISGRLVDEDGAPLAGMSAGALRLQGQRPVNSGRSAPTDDRGLFRIFGLSPGQYVVCAQPGLGPRTMNVTTVSRAQRYTKTCHPSAETEMDAQITTVTGFDVDGVEIRVRRGYVYTISGNLLDANGQPVQQANIGLTELERGAIRGGISVQAADGRFVFTGVVPGEYALQGTIAGTDGRPEERGHLPVRIDTADVEGVVVALKKPAAVTGRVVFEDGPPARVGAPLTVVVHVDRSAQHMGSSTVRPAPVGDDLTFTLGGLFGRNRLDVQGISGGYVVKSIHYKGEDITDAAAEFTTDPRHQIEIVLTSRTAQVSGLVTDEHLRPAADAAVLLIPADPGRRPAELYRLRMTMTSKEGRFSHPRVRAGDYLLVAVARRQFEELSQHPASAELLARHGERVSLVEHDRLTMDLRVVTLPVGR
jgi:protocatechuate 3,4-dioxygenase beta subunit